MPAAGWTAQKSRIVPVSTPDGVIHIPRRVAAKINFSDKCWAWTGATSESRSTSGGKAPYGITWDGERRVKAHRFLYESVIGTIPEGLQLDHLCRNTLCVRPSHLEPVTLRVNVLRGDAPGPRALRTNRCKWGHEFTPENTRMRGDGGRDCLTCRRVRAARHIAKRSESRRIARMENGS